MNPRCPAPRHPLVAKSFKLLFLSVGLLCSSVFAAESGNVGTIQGRVVNAASGQYVSKAVVSVQGTNLETLTDAFGYYTLNNVPAGVAKVHASFTGENAVDVNVNVTAGAIAHEDLMFNREKAAAVSGEGKVVQLNEFVVQSERYKNATEIAINEERYSPTLKNVVAAGAFGDIPDGNIGEFVKYIPGVQIGYGYGSTGMNAADSNATSISIRGFGPEFTQITVDGVPLTNASPATLTRAIGLDMMTINNASRVEVIKVPTPDMPSNSPGGAVNLVTKSAFEYAKPMITVNTSVSVNSEDMGSMFKKTPGPANKATYKTLPGVDFTYVLPISKTMGISFTGSWSRTFNENHRGISDYFLDSKDINGGGSWTLDLTSGGGPKIVRSGGVFSTTDKNAVTGAELNLSNPQLWRFQATDTPNTDTRTSGSVRFDWRPTPSQKLSVAYTLGLFKTVEAQRRLQFNPAKGYTMDWGPDYAVSYKYLAKGTIVNGTPIASAFDPKPTVTQTVTTRDRDAATHTGYISYEFQHGPWAVYANINGSHSHGKYADLGNGHFSELETSVVGGQMAFRNIKDGIPGRIEFYDRNGSPLDWTDLSTWTAPSISAKSGQTDAVDEKTNIRVDLRRDLDFIPWSWLTASAKTGWYRERDEQKKWGLGTGFKMTYYGPALGLSDYRDDGYSGQTPGFGLPGQQWVSTYKLYELWKQNPDYFNANSDADQGNNYNNWANQQKSITETSDQYYLMFDGKTLKDRLTWVFGARQEFDKRDGYSTTKNNSWNYVVNKDGTLYRDTTYPNGVRIDQATSPIFATNQAGTDLRTKLDSMGLTYPTHVISSSSSGGTFLEYNKLLYRPYTRMDGKITGKPTFTASGGYNVTENLKATLSWNRSQAKPDFENGILTQGGSGISISENSDPTASPRGTITIANPDLKPWIANSYNFQLAYYTRTGGKYAITPYYTATKNFHETIDLTSGMGTPFYSALDQLGLDQETYQDYKITTTVNGQGTSKTLGYELEVNQNLKVLGRWGQYFQIFGSFSHHYIKQNNTNQLSAKPMAGTTASGGISFDMERVSILVRGLYLQEKYLGQQTTYTYNNTDYIVAQYNPSTIQLDLNTSFRLTSHFSLFANARNFTNKFVDTVRYDKAGILPAYAKHIDRRQFGVEWYFGVRAQF